MCLGGSPPQAGGWHTVGTLQRERTRDWPPAHRRAVWAFGADQDVRLHVSPFKGSHLPGLWSRGRDDRPRAHGPRRPLCEDAAGSPPRTPVAAPGLPEGGAGPRWRVSQSLQVCRRCAVRGERGHRGHRLEGAGLQSRCHCPVAWPPLAPASARAHHAQVTEHKSRRCWLPSAPVTCQLSTPVSESFSRDQVAVRGPCLCLCPWPSTESTGSESTWAEPRMAVLRSGLTWAGSGGEG